MGRYSSKPILAAPKPTSPSVSKSMKSNKSSGTKPELTLSKLLQKKLYKNNLPGNPDFIYPRKKLAVFVHGCFWHRCPSCKLPLPKIHRSYWKRKFSRNVERDRLVKRDLASIGWKVLVVWEHDIKKNPVSVAKRIRSALNRKPALEKT